MTDWTTLLGGLLGGGAITTVASEIIRRRVPNRDSDADRAEKREALEDKARDEFRDELRAEVRQLRSLHDACEIARRIDQEKCQLDRMQDREQVATLIGQVDFLRKSLDNLATNHNGGVAPHVRAGKARKDETTQTTETTGTTRTTTRR